MLKGSCLCGAVRYEIDEFAVISNCHCSMCRKAHGAAFATFGAVLLEHFRFTAGEEKVVPFQSAPDNVRTFCSTCGSNLPKINRKGNTMVVPLGGMDDDPILRPVLHLFVGSKAPWHDILDEGPQFDSWIPGMGPDDED